MSKQEVMFKHIENWKQSGLTQTTYCQQQNLKLPTFNYWVVKYHKLESPSSDSKFITIEKQSRLVENAYEIVYPNGVILRVGTGNIAEVSTLLKLV